MFLDFFYTMRKHGLSISISEWMDLMNALSLGLADNSLMGFYYLCRCICIKRENHLDLFDQCFSFYFRDVGNLDEILSAKKIGIGKDLLDWLNSPIATLQLTPEEKEKLSAVDIDQLRKSFEDRLKEQTEKHDGGSKWVGTGGTSPFGNSGYHPSGIRVRGEDRQFRHNSAVHVAEKRRFNNLRHDLVLDIRQITIALKKLRDLSENSAREELNLKETIKKTSENCGDISIVMQSEKRNSTKLLLLLDVGGSMTPHATLSEQLFSAAFEAKHFRHFKSYYFHNCPYESIYADMYMNESVSTLKTLSDLDSTWKVIIVGDAAMSPYELTVPGSSVDWYHNNEEPGAAWLEKIAKRFKNVVWLNPRPKQSWEITSTRIIRQIFPMFPLTISGIEDAVKYLK